MNNDLISRKALLDALSNNMVVARGVPKYEWTWVVRVKENIIRVIKELSAADVGPSKQEWISVKDELPKKQRDYLCVCQFGDDPSWRWPLVLMFYPDKNGDNGYVKGPHFADEGLNDMRVAYWMPIQKLPKEEK